MRGRRDERGRSGRPLAPVQTKPDMAPTPPNTSRMQYSVAGASLTASPVSGAGAGAAMSHQ